MHAQALNFYRSQLADLPPLRVVEFGSRDLNGSVRDVYKARRWVGIDYAPGRGVDVVADAATWTSEERFDIVICAEVFEHAENWRDIVANAHTHLEPGGLFLASCASRSRPPHSAVDGGPLRDGEFYANVSPEEMEDCLTGWSEALVIPADGHFGDDDLYVRAVK